MKLYFIFINEICCCFFNKAALHLAVEEGNKEIVKLLLSNKKINLNSKNEISKWL